MNIIVGYPSKQGAHIFNTHIGKSALRVVVGFKCSSMCIFEWTLHPLNELRSHREIHARQRVEYHTKILGYDWVFDFVFFECFFRNKHYWGHAGALEPSKSPTCWLMFRWLVPPISRLHSGHLVTWFAPPQSPIA